MHILGVFFTPTHPCLNFIYSLFIAKDRISWTPVFPLDLPTYIPEDLLLGINIWGWHKKSHFEFYLEYPEISSPVLMVNVDLSKTIDTDRQAVFKSAEFCGQYMNLTFLSLHFTPQIELNERLEGNETSQKFIQEKFINIILKKLPKLKKLYLHACPIQQLVIKSNTLEKLCIYRSEFLEIKQISAPKLKTLMFHEGLRQFFKHFEAKKLSNSNARWNFHS